MADGGNIYRCASEKAHVMTREEAFLLIAGLQKMTLLDYPGKVACTVFLQGCNYRCPFCHNSSLLGASQEQPMSEDALFAFLKKRVGLLDAVCISGGEPTLSPELPELLRKIREMGFLIKLDTNGSRPQVLRALVEAGLVDYVAMDVKNSPDKYAETAGCAADVAAVEESLRFLMESGVEHELRTTVVDELHDTTTICGMGAWLKRLNGDKSIKKLFIQPFADRESVYVCGLHTPDEAKMAQFIEILRAFADDVSIRG